MKHRKIIYLLSLLLAVLLIIANGTGIMMPEVMYAKENSNWFAQSVGQDIADLVLVFPTLVITANLIYRNSRRALLVWAGVMVYLIYTFLIYCFAIHFNQLFIVYCFILGLTFYLFTWFVLSHTQISDWFDGKIPRKTIAVYMIGVASAFYILWLMQIIPPSFHRAVPVETVNAGLVTNPVHVLDLSVCLPGIIITGILLLRRHSLGLLLTPVVLTFFILMDLTIAGLMMILKWRGFIVNDMVLVAMLILALVSAIMLRVYLRNVKTDD